MDLTTLLTHFNLTMQEAKVYLALFSSGPTTGYEAAKTAGISRSNAYAALGALTEKGAAYVIEGNPTRYTPVPPAEFCGNVLQALEADKEQILQQIPHVPAEHIGYMTIQGTKNILSKVRAMLRDTRERVYVALSSQWLEGLKDELNALSQAGKKVVLITDPPFVLPDTIFYHSPRDRGQIRLIVDSLYVLTGEIGADDSACLLSNEKNLVDLFKEAMKNEIRLITLEEGKETP